MRSVSTVALLSAMGAIVNAAPVETPKGTFTISDKAPFQEPNNLPVLASSNTAVDLDMTGYDMGYHPNSDEFKCHGSCGIVLRISRTPERCNHPYVQPFFKFCFDTCGSLRGFHPYPPATRFRDSCNPEVQGRSTAVEEVTSTSAEVPVSTSSSQPASTTGASVSRPTGSAAPSGSSSSASPSRSPALPTGTPIARPSHPSGVASASGTVASTTPRATPTNAGPLTAGAASTSFSVIAAITVATLAIIFA